MKTNLELLELKAQELKNQYDTYIDDKSTMTFEEYINASADADEGFYLWLFDGNEYTNEDLNDFFIITSQY